MSDDVRRFIISKTCGDMYCCEETDTTDGDLVEYDDHARIVAAKDAEIAALRAERDAARKDAERLDAVRDNSWTVTPFDMQDGDIGWRVTEVRMGKPRPVVMAEVYTDDPRAAIDAARAAEGGTP